MNNITIFRNMLVGALEGGSNYWYSDATIVRLPDRLTLAAADGYHPLELVPTLKGGQVHITAEGQACILNLASLEHGLAIMQTKYPHHWANILQEDDDAETADVFLQCVCFGEVVYG
jgi:hypothetical protein